MPDVLRPVLRPVLRDVLGRPLTPIKGGGDIITSIFADGTDGFYFDFSKTDRLFQDQANTPADDPGENIGLGMEGHSWAGRTYTQQLALQADLATNGGFDTDTVWSKGANWSISGGKATHATGVSDDIAETVSLSAGTLYRVQGTISGRTAGSLTPRFTGGTTVNAASVSPNGTFVCYLLAVTGNSSLSFVASGTFDGSLDDVSVKAVPGNHGLQSTTAAQPKWQTGGLARFDGSDDHLLTVMKAATAMSLVFKCKASAATGFLTGVRASGTNDRLYLGFDGSGQLHGVIGDSATGTITRAGSLVGTTGVAALVVPGDGTAELFWNGVSEGTDSGLNAVNLTQVFAIGGVVIGGTPQSFINGDIYYGLVIKKALTAAQIAAITNKWGTS